MASKRGGDEPVASESDSDDGEMAMPMPAAEKAKKRKVLDFERVYVDGLPCADEYEQSYMHRDVVTHTCVAGSLDFIVTASADGHVKFWKKLPRSIEFVKHYKAHLQAITSMTVSCDDTRLCTASEDKSVKIYDVPNYDMIHMLKLPYVPGVTCWVKKRGSPRAMLAVAELGGSVIRVYNAEGGAEPVGTIDMHRAPVTAMAYNPVNHSVVSGDAKGLLEYWSAETFAAPERENGGVTFK
jgi:peptidylprolyl isomerase domain and WD repeat-containing protein 1